MKYKTRKERLKENFRKGNKCNRNTLKKVFEENLNEKCLHISRKFKVSQQEKETKRKKKTKINENKF